MAKNQHQNKGKGKGPAKPPNYLAPMTPQQLRKQAAHTIRAIYKPSFAQLGREQKRTVSIAEKRKADNAYYLNWLNSQSQQLQAHDEAANAALVSAGQQAQQEITKGYSDLQKQLVESGQSQPGVVSNAGEANAYDVSGEASRAAQQIGSERAASRAQIATGADSGAMAQANNFALIAAAEANRQADLWKQLSKFGDARQQLRLSRASDQAKEVARLFDREIEKTKTRADIHAGAVNAALAGAKFGLDKSKFNLDVREFETDSALAKKKFRLEKGKAGETKRHNKATEANTRASTEASANKQQEKENHKITRAIQEGVGVLGNHPKLAEKVSKDPQGVASRLTKILGSAVAANAAVELFTHGRLSGSTRQHLHALGYTIPKQWR